MWNAKTDLPKANSIYRLQERRDIDRPRKPLGQNTEIIHRHRDSTIFFVPEGLENLKQNKATFCLAYNERGTRKDRFVSRSVEHKLRNSRICQQFNQVGFDILRTVHRDIFVKWKPIRCTITQLYFDKKNSTCWLPASEVIPVWQIPIAVNTISRLLMMDSKSVRNM